MLFRLPTFKTAVIYILCCLILVSVGSCGNGSPGSNKPVAVRGVIDLGHWNFERDGAADLDGEWEFCWGRLMEPSDFAGKGAKADCRFIRVPGVWEDETAGNESLPGWGHATYRLKIVNGPDAREKTLSLLRVFSAYRLWINGKLADSYGSMDRSPKGQEAYVFVHNVRSSSFTPVPGVNEIVLQVSDYQYHSGGIGRPVRLDDAEAAARAKFLRYTVDMIIFGLLLFAGIYNILFYFFRRQDAASLYFGFFCLAFAVNTINHQFPLLSGRFTYPGNPYFVNYLTVILSILAVMMSIRHLFPMEFSKYAVRFYQALSAGCGSILLFTGFRTAEQMMKVYLLFVIIFVVYVLFALIKALLNRREDAMMFLLGFIPLILCAINDSLYAMWIIDTTNVGQYGLIVLCVVTTIVISRRFARALGTVEELSKDLMDTNISLQRMDLLKDQFLANTSHELRTPLHGMIGLSESMLDGAAGNLSPEARENLSLIASSGHRLASMVNDLLDMAKIQDKGLSLNLRPVDLRSLSDMVIRISLPLVGEKPLEIINNIAPDTPRVHADEERIRQVLSNLVGNAVKFTNKGVIEVSARAVPREDEGVDAGTGGFVEVSVSDTGTGVPEEYKDTIFEAYRQVDEGDTRSYPGTGLGLAIAKQIVEQHKGTIKVASGTGGGSVFSFTLPVSSVYAPADGDTIIIESMDDEYSADGAFDRPGQPDENDDAVFENNPVFLVVDDDPVNIRVIRNYLESRRCVVKTATDGIGALEMLDSDDSIDLVLLDIMMPVMSGYEVCRRIRATRPPGELPVIMLTAKNMLADIDAAFEAGANDYIVKPFRIRELLARVSTMLKVRNIRRSAAEGITIRDRNRSYSIRFGEIIHITSHSKNIVIHTNEGEIELPILLKEIIDRLPPDLFVRIHKSHIINIRHCHSLIHVLSGRYRVRLRDDDDTELPVGPAFLDDLRKKMR